MILDAYPDRQQKKSYIVQYFGVNFDTFDCKETTVVVSSYSTKARLSEKVNWHAGPDLRIG